jgi:hypothetical protein
MINEIIFQKLGKAGNFFKQWKEKEENKIELESK